MTTKTRKTPATEDLVRERTAARAEIAEAIGSVSVIRTELAAKQLIIDSSKSSAGDIQRAFERRRELEAQLEGAELAAAARRRDASRRLEAASAELRSRAQRAYRELSETLRTELAQHVVAALDAATALEDLRARIAEEHGNTFLMDTHLPVRQLTEAQGVMHGLDFGDGFGER